MSDHRPILLEECATGIEPKVEKVCRHERLTFGSGGYYVCCLACSAQWVARKNGTRDDDFDYERGDNGLSYGVDIRTLLSQADMNMAVGSGAVPQQNAAPQVCQPKSGGMAELSPEPAVAAKVAALEAELEAARRDAERYRWLRKHHWDDVWDWCIHAGYDDSRPCISSEATDAAIDAAISGETK